MLLSKYNIFKTIGSTKKPDIIFKKPFCEEYIAIELKNSIKSINVRMGTKIIDYYDDYVTSKTKYIIDEKEIEIKHFLIGTQFSPEGHLFKEEFGFKNNLTGNTGKSFAANNNIIPTFEYNLTHNFIRQLWQDWIRKGKDKTAGVGVLLSDSLNELTDNEFKDGGPAFMSQIYTTRWNQYWCKLK